MGQSRDADLGSIAGVLWGFDMLLEVLEKARKEFITPENKTGHLATCIDHSWHLFNKYYKLTDHSRVYVTAAVLDPRNKYQYFHEKWNKKHWAGRKQKTESMFAEFKKKYEDDIAAASYNSDILDCESESENSDLDLLEDFDVNQWRFGRAVPKESELERYLKSPLMVLEGRRANNDFDCLAWWKSNQEEYPILSSLARELYAIPGMSAEVERVFSGLPLCFYNFDGRAKQTITDRRNRLGADSVECIECLHYWLASGIVSGISVVEDLDGSILVDD